MQLQNKIGDTNKITEATKTHFEKLGSSSVPNPGKKNQNLVITRSYFQMHNRITRKILEEKILLVQRHFSAHQMVSFSKIKAVYYLYLLYYLFELEARHSFVHKDNLERLYTVFVALNTDLRLQSHEVFQVAIFCVQTNFVIHMIVFPCSAILDKIRMKFEIMNSWVHYSTHVYSYPACIQTAFVIKNNTLT